MQSCVLINIKRRGNNFFQTPQNDLHCIFCPDLEYIITTLWGCLRVPRVASSDMLNNDSHYHEEAFLGCDHTQTGNRRLLWSHERLQAIEQQCFEILYLVLKVHEH